MFALIKWLMTGNDILAGYKTHIAMFAIIVGAISGWTTEVLVPASETGMTAIEFIKMSIPYWTAIWAAFGGSAIKAGMDRK